MGPDPFYTEWHDSIGSTNDRLKKLFKSKPSHSRALILAESQTSGRGRMGRDFHSPTSGLYMSLGFQAGPEEQADLLTPIAAVAALRAIQDFTGKKIGIKWVNDLMIGDRKVGGILSELVFSEKKPYVIVGIGINRRTPQGGFTGDLAQTATALDALTQDVPDLMDLAVSISRHFFELKKEPRAPQTLEAYEEALVWKKQVVHIHRIITDPGIPGRILGIDSNYRLRVQLEDGTIRKLSSGEVRIRRPLCDSN